MDHLLDYEQNMDKRKTPDPKLMPSGIRSPNHEEGEMLILLPEKRHPQHPNLRRAVCNKTGWRGWV